MSEFAEPLQEEDFYYDGPYLVFTAAYHRKRGFCCGNGCRHCPYDEAGKGELDGTPPLRNVND